MHDRITKTDSVTAVDPGLFVLVMLLRLHGIGQIPSRSVIASAELGSAFQKFCAAPRSSVSRRVSALPAGNGLKQRRCRRSLHCATAVSCCSENSATAR